MKKLLFPFLLFPLFAFSQDVQPGAPAARSHELGLNLFSVSHTFYSGDRFRNFYPVPEVYYNYHFGKNGNQALRASIGYHQQVLFIHSTPGEFFFEEAGIRRTGALHAGYEHTLGSGRLQPFGFADLGFARTDYRGVRSGSGCFLWWDKEPFRETEFEGSLRVGAGVRYAVGSRILVTLESAVEGAMVYHVITAPYKGNYSGTAVQFLPVSKAGVAWRF